MVEGEPMGTWTVVMFVFFAHDLKYSEGLERRNACCQRVCLFQMFPDCLVNNVIVDALNRMFRFISNSRSLVADDAEVLQCAGRQRGMDMIAWFLETKTRKMSLCHPGQD